MPNHLLTLLDKIRELRSLANNLYSKIENYYRHNESGYVYDYPMNVPAGTEGRSGRPGHKKAFALASCIFTNLVFPDTLEEKNILSLFNFFNNIAICSEMDYEKIKVEMKENKTLIVLPQELAELSIEFFTQVEVLQRLLKDADIKKLKFSRAEVSHLITGQVNELMQTFGYIATDIIASVNQAIHKLKIFQEKSPQQYSEMIDLHANLLQMYAIKRNIKEIYLNGHWESKTGDETNNDLKFVFNNDQIKLDALTKFLVENYKDPSVLLEFSEKTMSIELAQSLQNAIPHAKHFSWKQMWTNDHLNHSLLFAGTLAKINNREFKLEEVDTKENIKPKK